MEPLVQRLVQNPHDEEAVRLAHEAGQSDPRAYAMFLEKVGAGSPDPAYSSYWLTEAANVWSVSLGDAHRAARALMIAIDRDPTQSEPADRLAELYREKGDGKALLALLERRAKALAPMVHEPSIRTAAALVHEELGRLWVEPPMNQPRKAIDNYRRAVELDPRSQFSIYSLRELLKASGQWSEAVPYFQMEIDLVDDPQRQLALRQDEAEVRRAAGDLVGASAAVRHARELEGGSDPVLKQLLATTVLERVQAHEAVAQPELDEAAALFVELAEEYPGEHGLSYAACAAELCPAHDRAVQLTLYYADQLGRSAEVAPKAAAYLKQNPHGVIADEARRFVTDALDAGIGGDALLEALAPPEDAGVEERVAALLGQANALARQAKKPAAAEKYTEVLGLEPANEEAVGFMETYLRQKRRFPELRDLLAAAVAAPEVDVELRTTWLRALAGLCEKQLRDMDGAAAALHELVSLDASDEESLTSLRKLLERAGRWDELAALLTKQAEALDDVEARIVLEKSIAKIHEQRRKDPVGAGEAWARIAALAPDDESVLSSAVRFFEAGERFDLAARVLTEHVGSVSDGTVRAEFLVRLGELRESAQDFVGAGDAYGEAATITKDPGTWEAAERCFVKAESWEQAASASEERAQATDSPTAKAVLYFTESTYLERAGDAEGGLGRIEQASELDPNEAKYAEALEQRYTAAGRAEDLANLLLKRAEAQPEPAPRVELRKRAAIILRDQLGEAERARASLELVLKDAEDPEVLGWLCEDAEGRSDYEQVVDYLTRLSTVAPTTDEKVTLSLREAALRADALEDTEGAIARYEYILRDLDPRNTAALVAVAELSERADDYEGVVRALERRLEVTEDADEQISIAERLADIYENRLQDLPGAIKSLCALRKLDPEDYDAVARLCDLSERTEEWAPMAGYLAELIEVEGDESEVSRMTRQLAHILHEKVGKSDDALAALMQIADQGDEACREAYVELGDELGWKGIVATKLVEWYAEAPVGEIRNDALRGAFERFLDVGRDADAAGVAAELVRTDAADDDVATKLEELAVELEDLDSLATAHAFLVKDLRGLERAGEMVRQAEVLLKAGVPPEEAIQHGEQGLAGISLDQVEPLLGRLGVLAAEPPHVVDLYERQVTRCKTPEDRIGALARAGQVAAVHSQFERARSFFDIALGGGIQQERVDVLVEAAREEDERQQSDKLRRTLAEAMAAGGQGARDGGRTRSLLLRHAATLAQRDLDDVPKAFEWLGDALVSFVDESSLQALDELALAVQEPRRAEAVLTRALEEVFDGPLVRRLLAHRAKLRLDHVQDPSGAAEDLKRLHDLAPGDTEVAERLADLYHELGNYRGLVQLYEDQILRGKDQASRLDLARRIARLWEETLQDSREAADAWRRVLRMKSGDPEAVEGLDRAKKNMLKPHSEPAPPRHSVPVRAPEPGSAPPGADVPESGAATGRQSEDGSSAEPEAQSESPLVGDGREDAPESSSELAASLGEASEESTPDTDRLAPAVAPPLMEELPGTEAAGEPLVASESRAVSALRDVESALPEPRDENGAEPPSVDTTPGQASEEASQVSPPDGETPHSDVAPSSSLPERLPEAPSELEVEARDLVEPELEVEAGDSVESLPLVSADALAIEGTEPPGSSPQPMPPSRTGGPPSQGQSRPLGAPPPPPSVRPASPSARASGGLPPPPPRGGSRRPPPPPPRRQGTAASTAPQSVEVQTDEGELLEEDS